MPDSHVANTVVDSISRLSPDLLADACQHILSYLQGQTRGVDSAEISDRFQRAGVRLGHEALQNIVRFLLLTLAVSSDTCRSLNSPYVTLLLKILEPSGQICQRCFEMTIPQFQNFHKQFKEMAAVMETV